MKSRSNLTLLSLFAGFLTSVPLMAANIVVNGDFSSNASSFTSFPGYRASGNPEINSWGFVPLSGGNAGINGSGTGIGEPFAPSSTVGIDNFAFIQNGISLIFQNIPLIPNQQYSITVAAANRNGNTAAIGRIQVGDDTMSFYTSGDQSFSTAAFQAITGTFTTPASFTGAPSLQLYNLSSVADSTVAYTNVFVEAIPEPASISLLGGALIFGVFMRRRRTAAN
jgi:hypothetical protein